MPMKKSVCRVCACSCWWWSSWLSAYSVAFFSTSAYVKLNVKRWSQTRIKLWPSWCRRDPWSGMIGWRSISFIW